MSRGIDVLTYAAAKAYTDKKVDEGGGGSGPTVVQTTGTSTTDVMSQNATTSMVFADPTTRRKVSIGDSTNAAGIDCICIGPSSNVLTGGTGAVSIGDHASASGVASIALGYHANATERGQMDISTGTYSSGYKSTKYRLLTGVYDGQSAHDAATVGQVNSVIDAINTALSTNIPHIGA